MQQGRDGRVAVRGPDWGALFAVDATGAVQELEPEDPALWVDVSEDPSRPLLIPAGAFAQVGVDANRALVAEVLARVGPQPGRLLELYAGSGNFTRHLVDRAAQVVATDGDPAAVARGLRNVPRARWVAPPLPVDLGAFDTVVLDPPRAGLDPADRRLALGARDRVVYVSCDPQTLARDVGLFAEAGLTLDDAVALDLMPQTYHVEVVALFTRVR